MIRKILLAGCCALSLVACGQDHSESAMDAGYAHSDVQNMMSAPAPAMAEKRTMQAESDMIQPDMPPGEDGATPQSGPMLAYVHNRSIEAPSNALGDLVATHEQRCVEAGPQVCMVVNASQSGIGEDWGNANLHIKATPAWTNSFLGGLEGELDGTKAKITSASTESPSATWNF